MYRITHTTQRAMGNAFLLTFPAMGKQIVLADGGEMQLMKALRAKALKPISHKRISNIDADCLQSVGVKTYIIEEE